jgi:diguanylate cyclase
VAGAASETTSGLGFLRHLFGERRPTTPATPGVTGGDPIAEAAMLALAHHGIRPTPEAYTLWYRHLAGERPDLSRRLKDLEARGEPFDAVLIGELHERYFGAEREVLQVSAASQAVERLLADLAHDLELVEADAAARGDRLDALGRALASEDEAAAAALAVPSRTGAYCAAMRTLVAGILQETAAMRAASYRLQRRAVESAGEVAQLRATIEEAGLGEDQDPVTGVGRQKVLQRALRRAVLAAEGAPSSATTGPRAAAICFLIVDLDDFRAYNDAHGRRLGDLVLKSTARHLARHLTMSLERGATIGRLDGAAFGIVLADTDLAGGEALAERLCRLVADMRLDPGDAELARDFAIPPVTVGIGVAAYHAGEPIKRLVGRAERARQMAKEAGGDRVVSERATMVVGRPKA